MTFDPGVLMYCFVKALTTIDAFLKITGKKSIIEQKNLY